MCVVQRPRYAPARARAPRRPLLMRRRRRLRRARTAAKKRMLRVGSPGEVSRGTTSAATRPPSGTAVCRTPSASPRSSAANQCMTARLLAEFTLAPALRRVRAAGSAVEVGRVRGADQECREGGEPSPRTIRSPSGPQRCPREHRHESTDPLRTQQHADLAQRQAVLLPERGHEHRIPIASAEKLV